MENWFRDEVVIFVATLGACGLLILGVLELVWPSRPASTLEGPPRHRSEDAAEGLAARR